MQKCCHNKMNGREHKYKLEIKPVLYWSTSPVATDTCPQQFIKRHIKKIISSSSAWLQAHKSYRQRDEELIT